MSRTSFIENFVVSRAHRVSVSLGFTRQVFYRKKKKKNCEKLDRFSSIAANFCQTWNLAYKPFCASSFN